MPKKAIKNAFFYYMIDFREEQRKKGVNYANMIEVQKAADPNWREANSSLRAHYENIAKQEKAKRNIPQQKYTSSGATFSEIDYQTRLVKEAAEKELKHIQSFVQLNAINKKVQDEDIYLIDVNALCETNNGYVFGEVTITRFNINVGVKDNMHTIINPPIIPIGYASDIKVGCEELGLNLPDSDLPKTNFMQLLSQYVVYLKDRDPSAKVMPPLYTLPEKLDQVQNFLSQICNTSLEDEQMFRVYKLDLLFFYVINSLKNHSDEGLPKESLALAILKKDPFKYTAGIACAHHEAGSRTTECTLSRVRRWAYTILDNCCPVAGVEAKPGQHVPLGMDIDAVLTYKEKKKEERRLPEARAPSSCNSRDSSMQDSAHAATSAWSKPSRTLKPLRKPTVATLNFQQSIVPAPELSESNFPPLNLGAGRGSSRKMISTMKNLDINK